VKKIAILPTLLTLGNAVCGLASLNYACKVGPFTDPGDAGSYFGISASLILMAMVFDALDGYAARVSKSASDFGCQLDSLSDAISFGVAPAFLLLRLGQDWQDRPLVGKAIAVIAAVYLACTLLRLARFNIESAAEVVRPGLPSASSNSSGGSSNHKRFKGLPSPAAAGCLASLAILRSEFPAPGRGWMRAWFAPLSRSGLRWGPCPWPCSWCRASPIRTSPSNCSGAAAPSASSSRSCSSCPSSP